MVRIAHLSDFHHDGTPELRDALVALVEAAAECRPDVVVVTGDLAAHGRPSELDEVATVLGRLGPIPRVVIPGNRDLEPAVGPPGEARPLPIDSDLDWFLALEPALSFGFEESDAEVTDPAPDLSAAFRARFGPLEPLFRGRGVLVAGVNSTPRLRTESLARAARRLRTADADVVRIFATHHGLLPVPGRKVRDGDLATRAGDAVALLLDLGVDLALHGHLHRAHAWQVSDGRHSLLIAGAGALVNDGRRDASFLDIVVDAEAIEVTRRTAGPGQPVSLFAGPRTPRPQLAPGGPGSAPKRR